MPQAEIVFLLCTALYAELDLCSWPALLSSGPSRPGTGPTKANTPDSDLKYPDAAGASKCIDHTSGV